jgi:hypothetical protein
VTLNSPPPRAKVELRLAAVHTPANPDRETPADHMLHGLFPGNPPAMLFDEADQELDMTAPELRGQLLKRQAEPALAEWRRT